MIPLRQKVGAGKDILKLEELSYIFSNIESILEVHLKLLKKLENIYYKDWPLCGGVGASIVENSKGFSAYGVYVANFVNSQDTVKRLRADKNSRFSLWLQEVEAKSGVTGDLQFLLSEPLHHMTKMKECFEVNYYFLFLFLHHFILKDICIKNSIHFIV